MTDREGGRARRRLAGVLTLAGEGSRMLPWSRSLRKEFLPLFDRPAAGEEPILKPVAHLVVETLTGAGADDLTLVVQPRDRATVENYFSIDTTLLRRIGRHPDRLTETREFYRRLRGLRIRYAVQRTPRGFGDAVLRAERSVGDRPFLLHASDAYIAEGKRGESMRAMGDLLVGEDLDAVLLVRPVRDPKRYGVVDVRPGGRFRSFRRAGVVGIEEKPERPRSRWAATAAYAFRPEIFDAVRSAARDHRGAPELELTWGIEELLRRGRRVDALVLAPPARWLSVGSPEQYLRALQFTHRRS